MQIVAEGIETPEQRALFSSVAATWSKAISSAARFLPRRLPNCWQRPIPAEFIGALLQRVPHPAPASLPAEMTALDQRPEMLLQRIAAHAG